MKLARWHIGHIINTVPPEDTTVHVSQKQLLLTRARFDGDAAASSTPSLSLLTMERVEHGRCLHQSLFSLSSRACTYCLFTSSFLLPAASNISKPPNSMIILSFTALPRLFTGPSSPNSSFWSRSLTTISDGTNRPAVKDSVVTPNVENAGWTHSESMTSPVLTSLNEK